MLPDQRISRQARHQGCFGTRANNIDAPVSPPPTCPRVSMKGEHFILQFLGLYDEAIMACHSRRGDSTQRNVNWRSFVRAFRMRLMHHKRERSRVAATFPASLKRRTAFPAGFRCDQRVSAIRLRNTTVLMTESRYERPWLSIRIARPNQKHHRPRRPCSSIRLHGRDPS